MTDATPTSIMMGGFPTRARAVLNFLLLPPLNVKEQHTYTCDYILLYMEMVIAQKIEVFRINSKSGARKFSCGKLSEDLTI